MKLKLNSFAAIAGILAIVSSSVSFANASPEWCEQQWSIESAKAVNSDSNGYTGLLKRWQQYRPKCAGTVAYEARLAIAYSLLGHTEKAREILAPFSATHSGYRYLMEFSLLYADMTDVMSRTIEVEDARRLEEKYQKFVNKYPDFPDGHGMLGAIQTSLNEHSKAIKSLEAGLNSKMNLWGVYRNLTISYSAVGKYEKAIHAANKAFQLNNSLTSDPYFAYALAKADAGVGDLHGAETVLRVIAAKVPAVRRDPEFKEAVDFVTSRMEGK